MSEQLKTDPAPSVPRATLLNLSLTQLVAGSLAAATAAALGSRLGVVGTITGAAIGSVVSAIASSIYASSMQRARDALQWQRLNVRRGEATASEEAAAPSPVSAQLVATPRPPRRLLATTTAVFALATAFLLGLQLASGTDVTGTSLGTRPQAARVEAPSPGAAPTPQSSPTGTPTPPPTTTQAAPTAEPQEEITPTTEPATESAPPATTQPAPTETLPTDTTPTDPATPTPAAG